MTIKTEILNCWEQIYSLNLQLDEEICFMKFNHGVTPQYIETSEKILGFQLPDELRISCQCFNHVDDAWNGKSGATITSVGGLHLSIISENIALITAPPFRCDIGVNPPELGSKLIPFASGYNSTDFCFDLNPAEGGKPGQIVAVCLGNATAKVIADNFVEFLQLGILELKKELKKAKKKEIPIELPPQSAELPEGYSINQFFMGRINLITSMILGGSPENNNVSLRLHSIPPPEPISEEVANQLEELRSYAESKRARAAKKLLAGTPYKPGVVSALVSEIKELNRQLGNDIPNQFGEGATEEKLLSIENELGFRLPNDLRELYGACADCNHPWPGHERTFYGWSIFNLPGNIQHKRDLIGPDDEFQVYPGARSPVIGTNLLPLEGGDPDLCYDLKPGKGGKKGQIVDLCFEDGSIQVVAPSLIALLEAGIKELKEEIINPKSEER